MISQRVSARALAEFSTMGGDLFFSSDSASMREGAEIHRRVQAAYGDGFEREVALSVKVALNGVELTVYGRADGVCLSGEIPVVEEIKSTSRDARYIPIDAYPAHWAQAEIYAYMLLEKYGFQSVETRLTYVGRAGESRSHARVLTKSELSDIFTGLAGPYCAWTRDTALARDKTVPTMKTFKFPYESYREGQREMAAAAYAAIRSRRNALIQAPTGIGKTMAALFAAVKAMGEGLTSRVFYLTARTTARRAASAAVDLMRREGLSVRSIVITAKEKACPRDEMKCDPADCPLACGYYDRLGAALKQALETEKFDEAAIAELAGEYELCPFELSLDLSLTRDVIICDYNYVFDPKVKLRRFFADKCDCALLIDEAHNLIDRAREMFSSEIKLSLFRSLRRYIKGAGEIAAALDKASKDVIKALKSLKAGCEYPRWTQEIDESLLDAVEIFADAAKPLLENGGVIADAFFAANDFIRVAGEFSDRHMALLEPSEKDMSVKLWCFDPSARLRAAYKKTRGAVLFSGTLSPMGYYAKSVGIDEGEGDAVIDLPSPFPSENLICLVVPVNTTYKMRDSTIDRVVGAIKCMCQAKTGNYIACFPSYKYLETALRIVRGVMGDMDVIAQKPGMSEAERERFISSFKPSPQKSMLALIAMGGVFSEGIDLPGELLSGAAIVGVGMPGLSLERAALAAADEDDEGSGALNAYTYPGIERVLQSAGRVIRSETDVGVVMLIDERFQTPMYEELLPAYWSLALTRDESAIKSVLKRFWRKF